MVMSAPPTFGEGEKPVSRQRVEYADGSIGSFDPVTGIYYDSRGNVVSQAPRAPQPSPAQPQNLGAGVFQDDVGFYVMGDAWDPDGGEYQQKEYITAEEAKRRTTTQELGNGGSGDAVGWANVNARLQEMELDRQRLEQDILQANRDYAMSQEEFRFKKDQQAWAESQGEKQIALEAARDAQSAWYQQQQIGLNIADMRRQQANLNAQMQMETAQFNASMGFQTQQANQQAREQRSQRLQGLSRDISEASRDPGDRAKLASYVLANSGWGQQDAGIARGEDFVTDESLTGLEGLLRTREGVMKEPADPFSFTPVTAPQVGTDFMAGGAPGQNAANSGAYRTQANVSQEDVLRNAGLDDRGLASIRAAGGLTPEAITAIEQSRVPQMEHGGMVEGAFIAGDSSDGRENREMIIPLADGMTLILPAKGRKTGGMPHYQDGGLFTEGIFSGLDTNRDRSRSFMDEANRRARAGTPFADELPTPVYASSPGMNPVVRDLLNALNASQRGIPTEYSGYLQEILAPAGMGEGIVRRSR